MTEMFGPVKSARHLEEAAIETIKTWIHTYLAVAERRFDRPDESMPRPRSYNTTREFTKWPEDRLPAIMVVSPGLAGERPRKTGDGKYSAKWMLGIGIVIKSKNKSQVNSLIKDYAAAIRALIVQNSKLGGYANGVEYRDENYNAQEVDDQTRTLATAQVIFTVEVEDVVQWGAGVVVPPPDPYDCPFITVESIGVEIENVEELPE